MSLSWLQLFTRGTALRLNSVLASFFASVANIVILRNCAFLIDASLIFHGFIFALLFQSVVIDMSIDNMNTLQLVPSKDYTLNRLTAGMLQLTAGTHLVLNETALHQGQLNQAGEVRGQSVGKLGADLIRAK